MVFFIMEILLIIFFYVGIMVGVGFIESLFILNIIDEIIEIWGSGNKEVVV